MESAKCIAAVLLALAAGSGAVGQGQPEERLGDGGLRIWRFPGAPGFRMVVLVGVGSRDEPKDRAGISHFLEHCLFASTARRSEEQRTRELRERSGLYNGLTTPDYTAYHVSLDASEWEFGVDWLTEMIAEPRFEAAEVERERRIVTEELLTWNGHTEGISFGTVLYGDHPLSRAVGGTEESIADTGREDLTEWYRAHYRAGNMVVAFSGDVPMDACMERIRQRMQGLAAGGTVREREALDPLVGGRLIGGGVGRDGFLLMGYHVEPGGAEDLAALLVTERLLDQAVFDEVRTARGLAYAPEIETWQGVDTWRLDCRVQVGDVDSLPSVVEGVRAALDRTEEVGEAGLDRARDQVLADLGVEDARSLVRVTALTWLVLGDGEPPDLRRAVSSLEPRDVRGLLERVARPEREYLVSNSLAVVRPSLLPMVGLLGVVGLVVGAVWWRRRRPRRKPRGEVVHFRKPGPEDLDVVERGFQELFRKEDEEKRER